MFLAVERVSSRSFIIYLVASQPTSLEGIHRTCPTFGLVAKLWRELPSFSCQNMMGKIICQNYIFCIDRTTMRKRLMSKQHQFTV
jgi:hypothetical protein